MGWWITLCVLFLLGTLPLGVRACYDQDGPVVKVVLGPVKVKVFPGTKKENKPKKEKPPRKQEKPEEATLPKPPQPPAAPKSKKKGGSLTDFLPFVKLGIDFLGDVRRKLRMKELYLRLILASNDPYDLAVNYGKTWAAVGNFLPALERFFVIQKRDVEVECDFIASETKIIARLEITMTLGRLLTLAAVYGVRGLKEFIQFRKLRKGGANK